MRTLEVLRLRLSAEAPKALADLVRRIVGERSMDVDVRIFRHARVETDLLVVMLREGREGWTEVSEPGLRVAALLRSHGVIEHSVWVEEPGPTPAATGE